MPLPPSRTRRLRSLVLLALLAGCGTAEQPVGPSHPIPAAFIARVSGDGQDGIVGSTLPQPLVVEVRDEDRHLLAGAVVAFSVAAGGGTISAISAVTDASGLARVTWTLGTAAGQQRVEAAIGATPPDGSSPVVAFLASARPDLPARLTKVAGDAQQGVLGGWTPLRPRVRVTDRYGNAIAGMGVRFAVVAGGGVVNADAAVTDGLGEASVYWRLGDASADTLRVTAVDLSPVIFSATAAPGRRYDITFSDSIPVSADAGSVLSRQPSVLLTERFAPVAHPAGVPIQFAVTAGGGSLAVASTVTDAAGRATAGDWALGAATGLNAISAQAPDGATAALKTLGVVALTGRRIAVGSSHSCAITSDGSTWCWGVNASGQLGIGVIDTTRPLAVPIVDDPGFAAVVAGWNHTCGLTAAGAAWCWGANGAGQLGDGSTSDRTRPTAVSGSLTFAQLAAGVDFMCGVSTAGALYCWGANAFGQLGTGTASASVPTRVGSDSSWRAVATGLRLGCGLRDDGSAWCWGASFDGELGAPAPDSCNGTPCARAPVAVTGGLRFVQLAAGAVFACGLTAAGETWCWGQVSQFGAPDGVTPRRIGAGTALTTITAGVQYLCGLTAAGAASCIGVSQQGALGGGRIEESFTTLHPVTGGLVFRSLVAGSSRTCGVATDDLLYCWGAPYGGSGSRDALPVPTRVSRL